MCKYGYVTHTNQRGMYKLDLANMRYTRSADLAPYNCVPAHIQFSALCKHKLLLIYYNYFIKQVFKENGEIFLLNSLPEFQLSKKVYKREGRRK